MRRYSSAPTLILAVLAAATLAAAPAPVLAQGQQTPQILPLEPAPARRPIKPVLRRSRPEPAGDWSDNSAFVAFPQAIGRRRGEKGCRAGARQARRHAPLLLNPDRGRRRSEKNVAVDDLANASILPPRTFPAGPRSAAMATSRPPPNCPTTKACSAHRPIQLSIRKPSKRSPGDADRSEWLSAQGRRRSACRGPAILRSSKSLG